ncbi:MarR family winged helix-turn-helix transcriptional regulator [Niabella drilacis]|uniref:DNA-binding transcriptional regulator, MarR family n=1 Tax=Niabella drilacis (strain DSM 25811 / CCM 8410 / CCUG 62505 / LMG 26954 / E90) TaxID=1285928 RepID=A0A1G6IHD0_NIADE|nr:MarR family winged helix-turn-helix transcriptional regulator [Niabella drilacis]SDC05947.1 DNA-binding transcriptional regulator, MarR family [Niabella drilacis]
MSTSDFDLKQQNNSIESKIVASLERISQAFRVLLWQESKKFSLSPIQVQVMIFLLHHSEEKRKVSYLADEFNMTKATISDTIKTLEQKNLIKKDYLLNDTRSYIINLTKKGEAITDKVSLFTKEIRTPINNLHQEDKENLLLSLLNIIRHLNKSEVITVQRMCMSCAYYQSSDKGQKHFCKLLNQELQVTDLRIDCPEHEMKKQNLNVNPYTF